MSWINHLPPACWSTFWKSNFKQQLGCRFDILDNESYFFVFWHMQLYMSWYIRSFFGFNFLNILYFFKYCYTNIFHRRSLYTFYSQPINAALLSDISGNVCDTNLISTHRGLFLCCIQISLHFSQIVTNTTMFYSHKSNLHVCRNWSIFIYIYTCTEQYHMYHKVHTWPICVILMCVKILPQISKYKLKICWNMSYWWNESFRKNLESSQTKYCSLSSADLLSLCLQLSWLVKGCYFN